MKGMIKMGEFVFSFLFESKDFPGIHVSSHEALGYSKDSSCAKLIGMNVTVLYTYHLMEWYGTFLEPTVTIYCDNKEAVDYVNKRWMGCTPKRVDVRNAELKRLPVALIRDHRKSIRIEHVDGHQDKKKNFDDLPLSEQVNVLCEREYIKRLMIERDNEG